MSSASVISFLTTPGRRIGSVRDRISSLPAKIAPMLPRRARRRLVSLAVLAALLVGGSVPTVAFALDEDDLAAWIRAHYSKREVMIPMRDGVELFTTVYAPNGLDAQEVPILLHRTPYDVAPYGADAYPSRLGPGEAYAREGFIFVYQDVRGKYMSEGEFVNMRPHRADKSGPRDRRAIDESTDTYDTIEWLLENVPGHNGKVGTWGVSYPGFYVSAGMIDSHPALVAASPQAPIADWFWDDMHRHGAFNVQLAFSFFSSFGVPRAEPSTEGAERFDLGTPDGYDFFLKMSQTGTLASADDRLVEVDIPFWNETAAHPNYDEFWQSRNILPHLSGIGAAVMTVGGWYDTEDLYGPLNTYRSVERQNPGIENTLVMGPWPHGGWARSPGESLGEAHFGFPTGEWYRETVEMPFFLHHLKGGPAPELPEALMFETGANRWRQFDQWPPAGLSSRRLVLEADGGLEIEGSGGLPAAPSDGDSGYDAYTSDPAKPVPYTTEISPRWTRKYMVEDQRFAARRPDVLVYESEPLTEDLTLAGPLMADLWVSTSGQDSDWVVKVIDVIPDRATGWEEFVIDGETEPRDPGGAQRLVRAEAFRGRFRESYEIPKPFVPDQATRVRFELHDVLHTFRRGHRVMVQIQSTWFPFIDRNPGTWVDNIFEATPDQFVPVTNRIYRTPEHPSVVEVGVLE
jgi:putative CocE/NonD family hydrolase